jgi:hypothetical protein
MTSRRDESHSRFWVAWLSASALAAAITYLRPIDVLAWLGVVEPLRPYLGLLYLGQLVAFWSTAAIGQWVVMRRRLPHGGRWGVMTFFGGLVATLLYTAAGPFLQSIWVQLFGVRVNPVGVALFLFQTNNLHQTLFFALQGAVFGAALASLQSLTAPFRWRGRVFFVALSTLAGAVALAFVWFSHATILTTGLDDYGGIVLGFIGVTSFVSPLLWIAYSMISGAGLHRLIVRWYRSRQEAITSSFD